MGRGQQYIIPLGDVVPPSGPWACTFDFLPWFYKVFHPYTIPSKDGPPPRGSVRLPSIPLQPQPRQPLIDYISGGGYSCRVVQIEFC